MKKEKKSLEDAGIESTRRVGRRSALVTIGASVVGAVALSGAAPRKAQAQTDSDSGGNADAAGRGRTGRTDSDSGSNSDRAGHGRRRCSDSDSGGGSDPAGRGRSC